jgi:hypothetical protein
MKLVSSNRSRAGGGLGRIRPLAGRINKLLNLLEYFYLLHIWFAGIRLQTLIYYFLCLALSRTMPIPLTGIGMPVGNSTFFDKVNKEGAPPIIKAT